jgi:Zn-dependent peptidase ImmA (M78 family)
LPVSLTKITKQANIRIIKNSLVNELKGNERGISLLIKNQWVIIYDDKEPIPVSRFTIAHELGHIFLGHSFQKGYHSRNFDKKRPDIENEADMFAARLLAPACVLHELGITSAEKIAKVCNISITAAKNRSERIRILEQRNAWYRSPLERQVIKQFENYIKENRLKSGTLRITNSKLIKRW